MALLFADGSITLALFLHNRNTTGLEGVEKFVVERNKESNQETDSVKTRTNSPPLPVDFNDIYNNTIDVCNGVRIRAY